MSADALRVAHDLVDRGVPVFACPPGDGPKGYRLPVGWQTIKADPRRLDVYRDGYALAAVCGHTYDVLDRDPRNQPGDLPFEWPEVYGITGTPGGGEHYWIAATGLPKAKLAQGWDLQAGAPDGTGRGFVFIPGTSGYGWLDTPRWARQGDDTARGLRAHLAAAKPSSGAPVPAHGQGEPIPPGAHQDTLYRYACSLRARAVPDREAEILVTARAADCVPPWAGPDSPWDAVRHAYRHPEGDPPILALQPVGFSVHSNVIALRPGDGPPAATSGLTVHDSNDLDTIKPPTPLITGLLDVDTVAVLAGKFGSYKTFVALAWAAGLATGTGWGPFTVPEPQRVLYVAAEGASGVRARLGAWTERHRPIPRGALQVIPHAVRLDRDVDALIEAAAGCGLIVLDTLHKMAPGAEEQSSKEMGMVLAIIDRLRRETGATILLIHHTGHAGERSRGSSAIEDDIDASWVITLDSEDRRTAVRTLAHRKVKDGELQESRKLEFQPLAGSGVVVAGAVENQLTRSARALANLWAIVKVAGVDPTMSGRQVISKLRAEGHSFDDKLIPAVLEHLRCEARQAAGELEFYRPPTWLTG